MKAKHFEGKLPKTVMHSKCGKCPYCKKSVNNLQSHLKEKHLDAIKQEIVKNKKKKIVY